MAESSDAPSTHVWSDIQKLGLFPTINSLHEYEILTRIGWSLANDYLSEIGPDPFEPGTAQNVHELMFGEVHPWAGQFRTAGQSVILSGYPGADSWRIPRELELLRRQVIELDQLLDRFSSIQRVALSCAFHHMRFERIHPFRDGNGRVGRLLLATAFRQENYHPAEIKWGEIRTDYFTGLKNANKCDLSVLANVLLRLIDDEPIESFPFPFRVAPRMFEVIEDTALEDDLEWSRNSRS